MKKEKYEQRSIKTSKKFLITPTQKTFGAFVLKRLSIIYSPLKVDRFELFMSWSNTACFIIDKRTRCKIYIMHFMINGVCKTLCSNFQ